MSQTARKFTHISAADYLAAENDGTWRHEFINGIVYATAGASERHNLIRGCLFATLYGRIPQDRREDAMELELFRRRTDGQREFYQRDNTVTFESVGFTINVSRLYRDIEFEDPSLSSTTG